jgi:hypothetical protein
VPWGPDDGTVAGSAVLSSVVFAPETVLPALRMLIRSEGLFDARAVHASGFNATARSCEQTPPGEAWISEGEFGLDQGMIVLMVENYRSGLMWRLTRSCPYIRTDLRRAGFGGGWLSKAPRP